MKIICHQVNETLCCFLDSLIVMVNLKYKDESEDKITEISHHNVMYLLINIKYNEPTVSVILCQVSCLLWCNTD